MVYNNNLRVLSRRMEQTKRRILPRESQLVAPVDALLILA